MYSIEINLNSTPPCMPTHTDRQTQTHRHTDTQTHAGDVHGNISERQKVSASPELICVSGVKMGMKCESHGKC